MPIYEYRCNSCAYLFEALQKVSDAPLKECPDCGALELRRLVSAPSFRLKGGGWYETDFKSEKERKRNLADRQDADGGSKSDKADGGEKAAKSDTAGAQSADKVADTSGKSRTDQSKHRSSKAAGGEKRGKAEGGRKKGKGSDNAVA